MSDLILLHPRCPVYSHFLGAMGAASATIFACIGAAYGTAKSGVGIATMGITKPELVMKCLIPAIMAGILGIYGIVVSVTINSKITIANYPLYSGALHLAGGLTVGLCCLAAGFAIGIVGDAGVRGTAQQPRLFVGMVLILIFAEVLGIYGLIIGLLLANKTVDFKCT